MAVETVHFGAWHVNATNEVVNVGARAAELIEGFLNDRYVPCAMRLYRAQYAVPNYAMESLGVPALVVRLDMPPVSEDLEGVYEVEANVSGLGITHHLGVPVLEPIVAALNTLGVSELGYGVAPSREDQRDEHAAFMGALGEHGIRTHQLRDLATVGNRLYPLWLRAGHEDLSLISPLMRRCLLLHYHGGGHKGYLYELDQAAPLTTFPNATAIFHMFPQGFVVKPVGNWGASEVFAYCPEPPWKYGGVTASKIARVISRVVAEGRTDEYLVQAFRRPEHAGTRRFRIWRLYAVWTGRRYQVIGGFWAQRNSLRVHGARDTVLGPLSLRA